MSHLGCTPDCEPIAGNPRLAHYCSISLALAVLPSLPSSDCKCMARSLKMSIFRMVIQPFSDNEFDFVPIIFSTEIVVRCTNEINSVT